jgi:methionine sulfoxide reductase heme-binding subunit
VGSIYGGASDVAVANAGQRTRVFSGKQPWLKPGVLIGGLIPLALLCVRAAQGTLGADPIALALNQLGLLALIFLLASLAATPLKLAFELTWPIRIRRMLGLFAFFYASLHFLLYALIDQGLALEAIGEDLRERGFIAFGFAAFLLLIPLAITSTAAMTKRLGARRWKLLHRLAYVAAILAVVHFVWRVKRDFTQPALYAVVLAVLLFARISARRRQSLR